MNLVLPLHRFPFEFIAGFDYKRFPNSAIMVIIFFWVTVVIMELLSSSMSIASQGLSLWR